MGIGGLPTNLTPAMAGSDPVVENTTSIEQADLAAHSVSLTARTVRGLKWTYLATLVSGVLQIAVTAIMSRLLLPTDYGQIAAAGLFLSFAGYFSEMGVGPALIQKLTLDDGDVKAAFTITSGIGLLAAGVTCACAPLARLILDTDQVVTVVRLISLSLLLNGLASTSLNLLRRSLRFDVLSKIEVGSYAISYGLLGVPMALAHCGIWALTSVLLLQPLLRLFFAYAVRKHSLRPSLDWSTYRGLLSFGSKISLTSFAEYVFFLADSCMVGRFWGGIVLGIYNRATLLAALPGSNLSSALMKVLFPAFARTQGEERRLGLVYLQGLAAISLITLAVTAGMVCAARDIVSVVLGSEYAGAAPLMQIIVLGLFGSTTASLAATVTNARGEVGNRLVQQLVLCVVMWMAVGIAAGWSVRTVALAALGVQTMRSFAFQRLAQKSLRLKWREVLEAVRPGIMLALCIALAVFLAAQRMPASVPAVRLLAELGAAAAVCMAFAIWFLPVQVAPFVVHALDASPEITRLSVFAWYRNRIMASLPA